jgi:integrative and conjugative element protein (TIGR02256 family)
VIDVLTPIHSLSRHEAALLNGFEAGDSRRVLAVGAGAFGSQVFYNLYRGGFGRWTLVDQDFLLPHNAVRHTLPAGVVGMEKAKALAMFATPLFEEEEPPIGIRTDMIHPNDPFYPGDPAEHLEKAVESAELILDMSASVSVARHLAHGIDSAARRSSLFLNPAGTDLVLLIEDEKREYPLNFIEMQYYRAILQQERLQHHLKAPEGRLRYARSCRDVTFAMPQDFVGIHSGIASRAFRTAISKPEAGIEIYQLDPADLTVNVTRIAPKPVMKAPFGDWTLYVDGAVHEKLLSIRASKLPNETGGVLLGSIDLSRKIVYVVDVLPSPPDSKEWPTLYIRGSEQLKEEIERVQKITAGNLEYVGEWHSHPNGVSARPSPDDLNVFTWLTELMDQESLPALMVIVADSGAAFYLGEMKQEGQ